MQTSKSRVCSACERKYDYTEFNHKEAAAHGAQYYCRACSDKSNSERMYVNGKYISRNSPLFKPGNYKTLDDAFDHTELQRVREGYVYVMINPAFPGWVKVGSAVSMSDRENSYQTGDPHRQYTMVGGVYTEDRLTLERACHKHCSSSATATKGEWFKLNEVHALNIIKLENKLQEGSENDNTDC